MGLFDRFNLGVGFQNYFRIQSAVTDTTRDSVFRIRHEVYCEELKFEPERPDRRESDQYDRHSLHCLLETSGDPSQLVGCTRLIMTDPEDRYAPLPFEKTCAHTIDRALVDPMKLPRDRIAEVSRLAVRARYRRRRGESINPAPINDGDFGTKGQPRFPYIPISLYLGAVALAHRSGVDTIFVLTEPRLAVHFARLGVDIRQIGGPVEHRGARVPSMMDVQSIIKNMRFLVRPLWRVILEEIDRSLDPRALIAAPRRPASAPQEKKQSDGLGLTRLAGSF